MISLSTEDLSKINVKLIGAFGINKHLRLILCLDGLLVLKFRLEKEKLTTNFGEIPGFQNLTRTKTHASNKKLY